MGHAQSRKVSAKGILFYPRAYRVAKGRSQHFTGQRQATFRSLVHFRHIFNSVLFDGLHLEHRAEQWEPPLAALAGNATMASPPSVAIMRMGILPHLHDDHRWNMGHMTGE
ncbi:hypothetical protein Q4610_14930 [Sphingobium sp. HBC34]|uniref:Uncharacterized protein n=1 Tax=Sphingobium cyanobacteriorum TaxID=3063954 RepID=A0ABT8ZP85_9SPHN|nr:hypothetical protein [Sphingobium sp. HBC34]